MNDTLHTLLVAVIKAGILVNLMLVTAALVVLAERKLAAWMQRRIGPNRVGPWGLLQAIADVVKLYLKEDVIPDAADRFFFRLAPVISIAIAVAVYGLIPWGDYVMFGDYRIDLSVAPAMNVTTLIIFAMTGVGVYGVTLAGWSSNNKYSLLGGLRSAAQMISYELSMGLSLIGVLMIAGSLNLHDIVRAQAGLQWNIFLQPVGFILFFVSSLAETNRAPFDLPEAEPELVGGYHTEYSGMKFGLFFLAEYANMFASSAIITTLFLGGWELPFAAEIMGFLPGSLELALLQMGTFAAKSFAVLFVFIWIRWSVPRFRYDQLMNLGWKVLLPIALVNILVTGIVLLLIK